VEEKLIEEETSGVGEGFATARKLKRSQEERGDQDSSKEGKGKKSEAGDIDEGRKSSLR